MSEDMEAGEAGWLGDEIISVGFHAELSLRLTGSVPRENQQSAVSTHVSGESASASRHASVTKPGQARTITHGTHHVHRKDH